jgi:hypothetical protein
MSDGFNGKGEGNMAGEEVTIYSMSLRDARARRRRVLIETSSK